MIKEYGFNVIISPDKTKQFVYKFLLNYQKSFENILKQEELRETKDVKI